MDVRSAWDRMNRDTQRLVVELYDKYSRTGEQKLLRELLDIFKSYDSNPDERELARILRR